MTTAMQAGTLYRYFRTDADHDVSGDTFELSLDLGVTWTSTGIVYVALEDLPPRVAAVHAAKPPETGFTGYWWRILTGPDTDWPLPVKNQLKIRGRLTDNPEIPHFEWRISVTDTE